jgi:hypothetical protein
MRRRENERSSFIIIVSLVLVMYAGFSNCGPVLLVVSVPGLKAGVIQI